jgi:hypothetical protein
MAWRNRRNAAVIAFSVVLGLLTSCATPAGGLQGGESLDLRSRLIAANLMAGSLAEGLSSAIRTRKLVPGSDRAMLIGATLEAVERSLDGAATALRAGLPDMATRQIGAAETQLIGLQPLLPTQTSADGTEDAP